MVRKKPKYKEVAEALAFVKSIRERAPRDNQTISDFLEAEEKVLHEMLLDSVLKQPEKPSNND